MTRGARLLDPSNLKGRIEAATPLWADAPKELATIQGIQTDYATAITTRTTAWSAAKKLRAWGVRLSEEGPAA